MFSVDIQCVIYVHRFHVAGLGYCLTFLPTVTILSLYFTRRRSLVTAVASTGESLSMFALAPGVIPVSLCHCHSNLHTRISTTEPLHSTFDVLTSECCISLSFVFSVM